MAQAIRLTKIEQNENENADTNNVKHQIRKVVADVAAHQIKRSALGDVGNRAIPKNGEYVTESSKGGASAAILSLKNIKPKVDSHWRKGRAVANPIVSRQSSMRALSTKATANSGTTAQVPALAVKQPLIAKITTTQAAKPVKIIERKTSLAKVTAAAVQHKVEVKPHIQVRREDSGLSRRSLSKIKAALTSKDKKQTTIVEPTKPQNEIKIIEVVSHSEKLLNEVENIDSDDFSSAHLVSEYVNDIYSYLYHLEETFPIFENHLNSQLEVTPRMRAVLIDWINEVHIQFHLIPETYFMAVGIIDRYLQTVRTTIRQKLQLVGITALFIAAKYEELYPPEIADFVYITDETYNKSQILEMERGIMKALDFQLGRPLSIHFLRRYSKAAKCTSYHHLFSKYFIELVTIEYTMSHYKPSEIAAASLFLSLILLSKSSKETEDKLWTPTLQYYSRYTVVELKPIVKKIAVIVKNIRSPSSKLKQIFKKYQSSKFEQISLQPEMCGQILERICSE